MIQNKFLCLVSAQAEPHIAALVQILRDHGFGPEEDPAQWHRFRLSLKDARRLGELVPGVPVRALADVTDTLVGIQLETFLPTAANMHRVRELRSTIVTGTDRVDLWKAGAFYSRSGNHRSLRFEELTYLAASLSDVENLLNALPASALA